jgi:hypothetical protein
MSQNEQEIHKQKNFKDLEEFLSKAIKKVGVRKENDLCKYIPMTSGGYMHHFTLRKMKKKNPQELSTMIKQFIINVSRPMAVAPKPRAARGSRKRRDQLTFTKWQLERMLNIARLAGDKDIISILSPKKSLASYKRELIQAIRQNKIDQELWSGYVEAVNVQNVYSGSEELAQLLSNKN